MAEYQEKEVNLPPDNEENRDKVAFLNSLWSQFETDTSGWRKAGEESCKEVDGGGYKQRSKKKDRYPLWWATQETRLPLLFSRVPDCVAQPINEDKDEDVSRRCGTLEQLRNSFVERMPYKDTVMAAVSDASKTQAGFARVLLSSKTVTEPIKIELQEIEVEEEVPQPVPGPDGQLQPDPENPMQPLTQMVVQRVTKLIDGDGNELPPEMVSQVKQDADGNPYIESEEMQEIDKPCIELKHIPFGQALWDHETKDYSEWESFGHKHMMSSKQVKKRYGAEAVKRLMPDRVEQEKDRKSRIKHEIAEVWFEEEDGIWRYIWPIGGSGLFDATKDPYGLMNRFPGPKPIFGRLPSDSSIPISEYDQLCGMLEEAHMLQKGIVECEDMIRPRGMCDKDLAAAIRGKTGDFLEVAGLAAKTQQGGNLALYVDTSAPTAALNQYNMQFDKLEERYGRASGYTQTLRGEIGNDAEKTATESNNQRMFTLHRFVLMQEDVQRFCRDLDRMILDLALSEHFTDEDLFELVEPSLEPEQLQHWAEDIKILRRDWKRSITIDIETDSTISIDAQIQKAEAMGLADAIGQYMDRMRQVVRESPALVPLMAKLLKHVVRKLRFGRAFLDDVEQAIDALTDQAEKAMQQQQPPDPKMMELQFKQQKAQSEQQIAMAKMQLEAALAQMDAGIEERKLAIQQGKVANDTFIDQARLKLDEVIRSLEIQEKFVEEQRLANQPPQQTVVVNEMPQQPPQPSVLDIPIGAFLNG